METEKIVVSYRDKSTNTNVKLSEIDAPRFANCGEAVAYFGEHEKELGDTGEEVCLDMIHVAYDILLQRRERDAKRPDKPKAQSNQAKFKQLSPEKQEELLRQAGLIE